MPPTLTLEQLGTLIPSALAVVEEAIESVKQANQRADRAEAALAAHRDDLELVKVAKATIIIPDDDIRDVVADLVEAGMCEPALATKLATDLKNNPTKVAFANLRRVAQISIPNRSTGLGVRKNAFSLQREDVADQTGPNALTSEEVDAARRLHAEGA